MESEVRRKCKEQKAGRKRSESNENKRKRRKKFFLFSNSWQLGMIINCEKWMQTFQYKNVSLDNVFKIRVEPILLLEEEAKFS